mmetsp:Transcript_1/g.2  ORF Transcript_1/g.2 Transcript_1/m.2 type:complete len:201 (-) Transcript_1:5-607(-)
MGPPSRHQSRVHREGRAAAALEPSRLGAGDNHARRHLPGRVSGGRVALRRGREAGVALGAQAGEDRPPLRTALDSGGREEGVRDGGRGGRRRRRAGRAAVPADADRQQRAALLPQRARPLRRRPQLDRPVCPRRYAGGAVCLLGRREGGASLQRGWLRAVQGGRAALPRRLPPLRLRQGAAAGRDARFSRTLAARPRPQR